MSADLRAEIEALADEWDGGENVGVEHVVACANFACKTCVVVACATDLRALLAAHPVQVTTAEVAFQEGYEFALTCLDDEPVQADLARLRPSHPVSAPGSCGNRPWRDANPGQVSQAGIGRTTRQGGRRE